MTKNQMRRLSNAAALLAMATIPFGFRPVSEDGPTEEKAAPKTNDVTTPPETRQQRRARERRERKAGVSKP